VMRAHDTKLGRDVVIEVEVSARFAASGESDCARMTDGDSGSACNGAGKARREPRSKA